MLPRLRRNSSTSAAVTRPWEDFANRQLTRRRLRMASRAMPSRSKSPDFFNFSKKGSDRMKSMGSVGRPVGRPSFSPTPWWLELGEGWRGEGGGDGWSAGIWSSKVWGEFIPTCWTGCSGAGSGWGRRWWCPQDRVEGRYSPRGQTRHSSRRPGLGHSSRRPGLGHIILMGGLFPCVFGYMKELKDKLRYGIL